MKNKGLILFSAIAWSLMLCSCGVTKHIPQGEYLLTSNQIKVESNVSKKEQITPSDIAPYLKQRPNKKLFGTNFYLWVYNLADPDKDNIFSRMYRRIGEESVIVDSVEIARSMTNITNYMESNGYYDAKESFSVVADSARRKAKVIYNIEEGTPYRIGTIKYEFRDNVVGPVVMADSTQTLLHSGDIFSENVLNEERTRIADLLKNRGYYNFGVDNILYHADSTKGDHTIDLKMIVRQYISGYDNAGKAIRENFTIYRLRNIYINPDYNPMTDDNESQYKLDTLVYLGLNIIYRDKPNIRKEVLRRIVSVYPNQLYDANTVNRTYENIMRLGYFKSASVLFSEVKGMDQNTVTFVGGDDEVVENTTTEGYLDCVINCIPALRQSYTIELEASTNSNYYALTSTLGYQNRNILKGADQLDLSLSGSYELMHAKGINNSYEVGGTAAMSFPRLITPFKVDRYNRLNDPNSKLELSLTSQRRPYYNRTISGVSWGYVWNNRKHSSFMYNPIDVNLIKMGECESEFFNNITNLYLRNSYESQLITGTTLGYVFNNQIFGVNKSSVNIRVDLESAGNLAAGLSNLFDARRYMDTMGNSYYQVWGINYAQYVRGELSFANKIAIGRRSALVYRLLGGYGLAYGNATTLPYDRMFYSGGSNSMRGWMVRTLGPGSSPDPENLDYPQQVGDMRLEANLEARFPLWEMFQGALFFDMGNVWYSSRNEGIDQDEVFELDTFYKQLGLNTGLGLRLDLDFFVLRMDWGIQLHNPNLPEGSRWLKNFSFDNTALHFGVGYPF